MVREIGRHEIMRFVAFGDSIYRDDPNYVPYIRLDLIRTLKRLVFQKKTYHALCSFDECGRINARVLLHIGRNKQLQVDRCGYFSFFEAVNDERVFHELMEAAAALVGQEGAEYLLGSFFPHDPDNRRGILIKGFASAPMLFTSHNPSYYRTLFENGGFEKLTDANEYEYVEKPGVIDSIREIGTHALAENGIRIDRLDLNHLDRDLEDVHTIMQIASTQVNFETVLSTAEIRKIFRKWRFFIEPDFALIARRNSDNAPVGFTLSLPDYFELLREMRGRLDPRGLFLLLTKRRHLTGLRAVMQYIIPDYQHKGISKALYYETKKAVDAHRITRICLGTIMEKNGASNGAITSLGGELSRVYRIYYKKI